MKVKHHLNSEIISRFRNNVAECNDVILYNIALRRGKGVSLEDVEGNQYLDLLSGASASTLGYNNRYTKEVIKAYIATAKKLHHSCVPYSPMEDTILFAKKLIDISPGKFDKRVIFSLGGSQVVEAAIKAAVKATSGRKKIIIFKNSFYGSTGLSLFISDLHGLSNGLWNFPYVEKLDFPKNREQMEETLSKMEAILRKGDVCAIIAEVIQGLGGAIMPPMNFFSSIQNYTSKFGAIFIVDEIKTIFRTGKLFSIQHYKAEPDILTVGKGISAGFVPISAAIGREEIVNALGRHQHVETYCGHPPSCAVALKVIEIIEEEKLSENAGKIGTGFIQRLQRTQRRFSDVVADVRGLGLMIGVEFNKMFIKGKNINQPALLFGLRCTEKGIYPGYSGVTNNVLRIEPALIFSQEHVKKASETIDDVAEEISDGEVPTSTLKKYNKILTYRH